MSPGDKVYLLDGWRICRVVLAQSGETFSVVRRRMPGHPDLVTRTVSTRDVFPGAGSAGNELQARVDAAIAKYEAVITKLRAFDFNEPVLDVSEPPKGAK